MIKNRQSGTENIGVPGTRADEHPRKGLDSSEQEETGTDKHQDGLSKTTLAGIQLDIDDSGIVDGEDSRQGIDDKQDGITNIGDLSTDIGKGTGTLGVVSGARDGLQDQRQHQTQYLRRSVRIRDW